MARRISSPSLLFYRRSVQTKESDKQVSRAGFRSNKERTKDNEVHKRCGQESRSGTIFLSSFLHRESIRIRRIHCSRDPQIQCRNFPIISGGLSKNRNRKR